MPARAVPRYLIRVHFILCPRTFLLLVTAPNLVPLAIEAYSKVFETMTGKDDKLGVVELSSCVLAPHKLLELVNMPPNFKNSCHLPWERHLYVKCSLPKLFLFFQTLAWKPAMVNIKASVNRYYCLTVGRVLWCSRRVTQPLGLKSGNS